MKCLILVFLGFSLWSSNAELVNPQKNEVVNLGFSRFFFVFSSAELVNPKK